jgi:hypothetical protein
MTTDDEARAAFAEAVNMKPKELQAWLETEDSLSVGQDRDGDGEAEGHAMGRQIVELLQKKRADQTEEDVKAMRHVVSYVHRHLAQGGPKDDKEHSRWRYSLMNWGHDPLKGGPHPTGR